MKQTLEPSAREGIHNSFRSLSAEELTRLRAELIALCRHRDPHLRRAGSCFAASFAAAVKIARDSQADVAQLSSQSSRLYVAGTLAYVEYLEAAAEKRLRSHGAGVVRIRASQPKSDDSPQSEVAALQSFLTACRLGREAARSPSADALAAFVDSSAAAEDASDATDSREG